MRPVSPPDGFQNSRTQMLPRSSIGSPRCAHSQSITAVTRSPSNMKFTGPVSPCTSETRAIVFGTNRSQPVDAVSHQRIVIPSEERAPLLDDEVHLAERAVRGRWRAVGNSRDRERSRSSWCRSATMSMKSSMTGRCCRAARFCEVCAARHALEQRARESSLRPNTAGHRDRRALQGLDDAGLARQRPRVARLGRALEPQEPLGHVAARALHVDDPGLASCDCPLQSRDFTAADLGEPFGNSRGKIMCQHRFALGVFVQ